MKPLTINERVDYHSNVRRRFNSDTSDHEMTILLEQGNYRHLRFRSPKTGMYWFDLITWPGNLTIRADMGNYSFARETDMFAWFGTEYVNAQYWAEKLTAQDSSGRRTDGGVQEFQPRLFKEWVLRDFWDRSRTMDAKDAKTVWDDLRIYMFEDWSNSNKTPPETENEAADLLNRYSSPLYDFHDWYESTEAWKDYTVFYLWCCHAIISGIRDYREHQANQDVLTTALADTEGQQLVQDILDRVGADK